MKQFQALPKSMNTISWSDLVSLSLNTYYIQNGMTTALHIRALCALRIL